MEWLEQYERDKGAYQRHCAKCGRPFTYDLEKRRSDPPIERLADGMYAHVECQWPAGILNSVSKLYGK